MKEKLNNFYFEKIDKDYFISNDSGEWILLKEKEFKNFIKEDISPKIYNEIKEKNFLREKINFNSYFEKYYQLRKYTNVPPSLHIIVLTLQCNHFCVYCRATSKDIPKNAIMSYETAKKSIDFIFFTPSDSITIEFQGGEALLNWSVLKKTIEYIKRIKTKKDVKVTIVTNLTLMTEEKLNFLIKNNVSICTSLDGPEKLHNENRIFYGGSSQKEVVKWFKIIKEKVEKKFNGDKDFLPSALMTTTKSSLPLYKEIIDVYRQLNTGGIFLRPLSPIGYAKKVWNKIGYEVEDFLEFYEKSLDYILEINLKKERFIERNSAIKIKKILNQEDPNFLDLRSPCGAGIGQIAYNYNGDIYTCDEGRMVGSYGDDTFKIGNVFKNNYKEVLNSPSVKICSICSCTENQNLCAKCAFKPYCGVCPVYNYETSKTPWGSSASFNWCKMEKGIFKILIRKIKNPKYKKIFEGWLNA